LYQGSIFIADWAVIIDFPGFLKDIWLKGQRNGIRLVNFYGSSGSNVLEHKKKNISRPAYAGIEPPR